MGKVVFIKKNYNIHGSDVNINTLKVAKDVCGSDVNE